MQLFVIIFSEFGTKYPNCVFCNISDGRFQISRFESVRGSLWCSCVCKFHAGTRACSLSTCNYIIRNCVLHSIHHLRHLRKSRYNPCPKPMCQIKKCHNSICHKSVYSRLTLLCSQFTSNSIEVRIFLFLF